jgi:hypothetical protein
MMGVTVNGYQAARVARLLGEAGIEVKPSRIGIDFQGGASRRRNGEHPVPVEFSTFSPLDEPA